MDITSSGATLAANGLKVLSDGLILRSEAQVAASLWAGWDAARLDACRRLLSIIEARARGKAVASLAWPPEQDDVARSAVGGTGPFGANGALIPRGDLFDVAHRLAASGVGPVTVSQPAFVFEAVSEPAERLAKRLGL